MLTYPGIPIICALIMTIEQDGILRWTRKMLTTELAEYLVIHDVLIYYSDLAA